MRQQLDFPPVIFTGLQAQSIGKGFATAVARSNFHIVACAILPNHVHLVVMRHKYKIEQVVNLLKGAATKQLLADGRHPLMVYRTKDGSIPSPWERNCDKVFLFNSDDVRRSIRYDEQNPIRAGFKAQNWSFVVPYTG